MHVDGLGSKPLVRKLEPTSKFQQAIRKVFMLLREIRSDNKLVGNSVIYTAGHMAPQVINVAMLPILTRFLTPGEYGIYSYTTAVCAFLAILGHLAIHSYLLSAFYSLKKESAGDDFSGSDLFGTIFMFLVVYSLLFLGLAFMVMPRFMQNTQVPFEPYMRLALMSLFIEIIAIVPLTYFRIHEKAAMFVTLAFSQFLLNALFSLILITGLRWGILGRYYGQLGANLVMLIAYLSIMWRVATFRFNRDTLATIKAAIAFAVPMAGAELLYGATAVSDRIILERFAPISRIGVYSVGFSLASGIQLLASGIYKAIEPEIFRVTGDAGLENRLLTMKRYIVLILLVIACIAVCLSREIVTMLAQPAFGDGYIIMALVAVNALIQGATIPVSTYIVALKKTRAVPMICLMSCLMSVALNCLLIPRFGIYGAAVGGIGAALTALAAYVFVTERSSSLRWNYGPDLSLAAVALMGSAFILQVRLPWILAVMAIKLALLGAWLFILWQTRLFQPERQREQACA
jgi:O-antigen/teichoic acid export membrane protein